MPLVPFNDDDDADDGGTLLVAEVQLFTERIGDSGVEITSGLAEAFDWLEVLEIDCVGDNPALPIVECPNELTDAACGY